MYSYIKGKLTVITNEYAVLETGGIGYKLFISLNTVSKLSKLIQKDAMLYTHLNVKDDALQLYGFFDNNELMVFKNLLSVSGVGPKAAMSVLSTLTTESFALALANGDAKTISQSPGVGVKTAQKIIIELKDKLAKNIDLSLSTPTEEGSPLSTVIDTLSVYGFSRAQITQAIRKVDTKQSIEEILRQTLKILGEN